MRASGSGASGTARASAPGATGKREPSWGLLVSLGLKMCRYSGDWDQDVMQGQGTYTFSNGDTYVGQYVK